MARARHNQVPIELGQRWRCRATKEVWEIVDTRRFVGGLEDRHYTLRLAGHRDVEVSTATLLRYYKLRGDGPSNPRPTARYDT